MASITLTNGETFNLKDSRFIHIYLTVDGITEELHGFQEGEAVSWDKDDDDVTIGSDFHGFPIGSIAHMKKGKFTLNLNDGSPANRKIYNAYNRQQTYSKEQIPTFGLKVVNENNGEEAGSPTCLIQKMPSGNVTNALGPKTWTVLGLEYYDEFKEAE